MNLFLNTGKALRFDTSSNIAVSENPVVNLLVIAFSPNEEHFP